ncbi:hypothetical protein [Sphingomonas glacialis]|uniref:Uncharacterized protein n=1 Tax=Sphingomonas glacialis TaxID=658225 RepID=A0A502FT73_9SPHN|nr:hypothetical protein [Sphingomonas glacialis]TPG52654.1 hypothetical protein EAH76_12270 [Sphingomonas glacialis]
MSWRRIVAEWIRKRRHPRGRRQLVAGIARNLNFVGRPSLRFRGLDWFGAKIRAGMERHADVIARFGSAV